MESRFVRDTVALQIGKIIATVLSLTSTVIVLRLLGPDQYGVYGLAVSFLALWQTLDLTGLSSSTGSRLAVAIGARDDAEVINLIAYHLQIIVLLNLLFLILLAAIGQPLADNLHDNAQIGDLATWLQVAIVADVVYSLILTTLQSRRSMQLFAILGVVNQLVLSVSLIAAALIDPRPEALVVARLIYSYVTLLLIIGVYVRERGRGDYLLPTFSAILRRVGHVSPRPYWRFGIANALDKNLAEWFIQLPIQIVGIVGGGRAVGYLNLAMVGINNTGILTSAIFENLKAVVPQAVGRRDYVRLWRGIRTAVFLLAVGGAVIYFLLAVVAPFVIPPVLGDEWIEAIPALIALTPFGVITGVAGIFGPIYRALELMRGAILSKVSALVAVLLPGTLLLLAWAGMGVHNPDDMAHEAAIGGALIIDVLFFVQAILTARAVLPTLRRLAQSGESS